MTIKTISFDSVMLYFKPIICEDILNEVQYFYYQLKNLEGIVDLIPSYSSILLMYNRTMYDDKSIKELIHEKYIQSLQQISKREKKSKLIRVPTNYNDNLDLERVAQHNNLCIDEVINLHSQRIYRVYAIGFMVGFSYLAKVDRQIATPRLKTPRNRVAKGSVAIADRQTAIYPQDSAGGWNIIGHTEFSDFNLFEIGDEVQFVVL